VLGFESRGARLADVLVSTEWLATNLDRPGLVVVDMRWRGDGSGEALYREGHIPGAVYLDWSTDLVDPHHEIAFMLAPPDRFAAVLWSRGIGDEDTLAAYADEHGSGPYRLWWASRVYGHDTVRVLDGGWEKWVAEGRPTDRAVEGHPSGTQGRPAPSASPASAGNDSVDPWTARRGPDAIATADDVMAAEARGDVVVLDSRPPEQFRGEAVWFETGPVPADRDGIAHTPRGDLRAGRVPWARSVPADELYRADRTMKPPEELRTLFARVGVEPGTSVITHCGVGISASALAFALHRAGIDDVKLYDASWEEWGRDPKRPVVRGDP
jgi:thiosulfate/3-mercaptopyruvate sulfurtransferase